MRNRPMRRTTTFFRCLLTCVILQIIVFLFGFQRWYSNPDEVQEPAKLRTQAPNYGEDTDTNMKLSNDLPRREGEIRSTIAEKQARSPLGIDSMLQSSKQESIVDQNPSNSLGYNIKGPNRTLSADSMIKSPNEEIIIDRDPSRIPGYIKGHNRTFFGYVLRDLSSRILSREVASSNVLVVSPNAVEMMTKIKALSQNNSEWDEEEARKNIANYKVGESFLLAAAKQGHRLHSLPNIAIGLGAKYAERNESTLDQWWASLATNRPSWILLAVFDPPLGNEDSLLSSATASTFLSEATVTYIVFRVHASALNEYGGVGATRTLLDHEYKIQILSVSHSDERSKFVPNTLLTADNVNTFFATGAMQANDGVFFAYLFATQGHDLAIPSRREYVDMTKMREPYVISMKRGVPYLQCPTEKIQAANIQFRERKETKELPPTERPLDHYFKVSCYGVDVTKRYLQNQTVDESGIWISGSTPKNSEAACVRIKCGQHVSKRKFAGLDAKLDHVDCTTRVLSNSEVPATTPLPVTSATIAATPKPNLLVIMIDPISRARFSQALPKTKTLLSQFGFTSFHNYTAVGNNSGPNQAALYSGVPLSSREEISSAGQSGRKWLWDELKDAGYATFKSEDGCIKNSNMLQSMKVNTTHGNALHQMICFDFARPNCIGKTPAAVHLTTYATQFINQYNKKRQPWAAFLHFIDSHEDSGMMAATLDGPLHDFLNTIRLMRGGINGVFQDTVVAVTSDHGLHYGPFFQSIQGKRERAQPVLQLKLASAHSENITTLIHNSDVYVTPFDVHTTLLDATLGNAQKRKDALHGVSLLSTLPSSRQVCRETKEIPEQFCDLFDLGTKQKISSEIPSPPSILSFYADIPKENRAHRQMCSVDNTSLPETLRYGHFEEKCRCTTSHKAWHNCSSHPWGTTHANSTNVHEHFVLIDCPNKVLHFETRITREQQLADRFTTMNHQNAQLETPPPNILFLEIDSVSIAYANRHFPKTRELLKSHRIHSSDREFQCKSELCSADFSQFTIIGPHSVSNQVSALSGCAASPSGENCNTQYLEGAICNDTSSNQSGLRLVQHSRKHKNRTIWCLPDANIKIPSKSPWLFDVAKTAGYLTLFAEEFCWEGSPYVTQGSIFPIDPDIAPHKVFCRLAERTVWKNKLDVTPKNLWKVENSQDQCIEGLSGVDKAQISLDFITQMWDAYSDRPKFAFLGAIAAHDYDPDWSRVAQSAELYDDHLSSFLESMFLREDANNTIIVLRSDHGLQYGPLIMDYSTQIEHGRPWTEIVVPKGLRGLSLDALVSNQERLASGYDLYRTIRALMATPSTGASEPDKYHPSVPDWSYNLLTSEIPKSRSCTESRVPLTWCRDEVERTSMAPNFGICNPFISPSFCHA